MECGRLLAEAVNAESDFAVIDSFGHPEAPRWAVFELVDRILAVAYTAHTISAQIDAEPLRLATLDDETISFLTIVHCQDDQLWHKPEKNQPRVSLDTLSSTLIKGEICIERHLAVVVATSRGKLYTIELVIDQSTLRILSFENTSLLEVLPPDNAETARIVAQNRLARFAPTGEISHLTQDADSNLWIAYQDGTVIKLHPAAVFPSLWQQGAEQGRSLDDLLGVDIIRRCKVRLSRKVPLATVVPLFGFHPADPLEDMIGAEAMAYAASDSFPTLRFYSTSKTELLEEMDDSADVLAAVVDGTKELLGSVVGRFWRRTSLYSSMDVDLPHSPFPSLWKQPLDLVPGLEFDDPPRQITACVVNPDGTFAACCDNLGRVLLFDLVTKQTIRLWKGFRETTCYWMNSGSRDVLVMHGGFRGIVEVWDVRRNVCLHSFPATKELVLAPSCGSLDGKRGVYRLRSVTSGNTGHVLEPLALSPTSAVSAEAEESVAKLIGSSGVDTQKLQRLQQMLSDDSNLQVSDNDVFGAFVQVTALGDVAKGLDLMAVATVLEEKLNIDGLVFQKRCLEYARSALGSSDKSAAARSNPGSRILRKKIQYHDQVVQAYEILRKFKGKGVNRASDSSSGDLWAVEARGWASTYSRVMGRSTDVDSTSPRPKGVMSFTDFAASLRNDTEKASGNGDKLRIYFSDSSRTRRRVLAYALMPLLGDSFAFTSVISFLEALQIHDDADYLMTCFADWFMTLPVSEICSHALFATRSILVRFLYEVALKRFDKGLSDKRLVLDGVHSLCTQSEDLVRAFMLACVAREAVSRASNQKERTTYGRVSSADFVSEWETLLRRIRVCLLVSLRLKNEKLGAVPLTVETLESDEFFSVYQLIARDELAMSQKHEEVVSLEKACALSSLAFDPSTPDGDGQARFKVLQSACLAAAATEEERSEYLVGYDEDSGALLLFLREHCNARVLLLHRVLLLLASWGRDPANLAALEGALVTLRAASHDQGWKVFTVAVYLEFWQAHIAPVYRAHLFGFSDVHELSEDVIAPLLENRTWFGHFGSIAIELAAILRSLDWGAMELNQSTIPELARKPPSGTWPPVRGDPILDRLVSRLQPVDTESLDCHCAVMCALFISDDMQTLVPCVPSIYECFAAYSLFNSTSMAPDDPRARSDFLVNAVSGIAEVYDGLPIDRFGSLSEVELVASIWGVDMKLLRTKFLLAFYENNKDSIVDELVTKSAELMDVSMFIEDGVVIVCLRVDDFLRGKVLQQAERRRVLGLLDPQVVEWVRDHARLHESTATPAVKPTMGETHILSMRLLALAAGANTETTMRARIHSLIALTGTVLKAMEDGPH